MASRRELRDSIAGDIQRRLAEDNRQRAIEQFEERLVVMLLARLGLTRSKYDLLRSYRNRTGFSTGPARLTLLDFNDQYPTFPFVLGAGQSPGGSLHTNPLCTFSGLMLKFEKSPFYCGYSEFHEQIAPDPKDRAIGLVFPHAKVHGGIVVYSDASLSEYLVAGTAVVYKIPESSATIVVQRFESLIAAIKQSWQPQ